MSGRLTEGFRNIIDLRWRDFIEIEESLDATNFDAVITGIIRACAKGNLRAIQTGLDRLDGKIAMELEVEYPKFYTLYPLAEKTADDPTILEADENGEIKGAILGVTLTGVDKVEIIDVTGSPTDMDELYQTEEELPTGSLRAMLEKLLNSPKQTVAEILVAADAVDKGDYTRGNPMVKSVVIAGLMKLVHDGRMSAVFEVFDQIDGKVADKVKVLGNDVYTKRYDLIAPAGAVKNEDGIYMIEAQTMTDQWATRLEQIGKGKNGR